MSTQTQVNGSPGDEAQPSPEDFIGFNFFPASGRRPRTFWPPGFGLGCLVLFLIGAAFVIGGILWFLGAFNRGETPFSLSNIARQSNSSVRVESQSGVQLFLEQNGESRHVLVSQPNQLSWLLVSRDDTTASNPALSPDGSIVAYVSQQQSGQIVAVSIISNTETIISLKMIKDLGQTASVGELKICAWTPIKWNSQGNRLAFFACGTQNTFSVAAIGELSNTGFVLKVAPYSRLDSSITRPLRWTDDTNLAFAPR